RVASWGRRTENKPRFSPLTLAKRGRPDFPPNGPPPRAFVKVLLTRFSTTAPSTGEQAASPDMTGAPRIATYFHVHLVSDSTGETLNAIAKAVCARFEAVLPIEHSYALVRSRRQLDRV